MRIAINGRSIQLNKRTGIGRYTYHLIDSLGQIDHANTYILHASQRLFSFKRRLPDFPGFKNLKRYADYFNQGVGNGDIYHLPSPDVIPVHSGRLVVTVHDLIYKTYPQAHTTQTIDLTEKYMQDIAAKAHKIICISENTRRDLHSYFDIPPDRTCVVYNGVDHRMFYPLSSEQRLHASGHLKQLGIDKPYVLYVGTIEPRKNLTGLLESFARLKSKKIFQGQLVVAGMQGWMMESISSLIKKMDIQTDVIVAGYVTNEELCQLYNRAEVFVFPSFYEGFGFPVLEAFCCGTAVITSSTSSCGEIAGEAALTVDPQNSAAITNAMEQVLTNKDLREALGQAGLKRAQQFSFSTTARQTLNIYHGQLSP